MSLVDWRRESSARFSKAQTYQVLPRTTKNPNVSDEAKQNAQERLRDEYGQ